MQAVSYLPESILNIWYYATNDISVHEICSLNDSVHCPVTMIASLKAFNIYLESEKHHICSGSYGVLEIE